MDTQIVSFIKFILFFFLLANFFASPAVADAQDGDPPDYTTGKSILPYQDELNTEQLCQEFLNENPAWLLIESKSKTEIVTQLDCAIKTGQVHIWMIPYFIKYLAEFLIGLAGILCMLFITIGGYHYVLGGVSEEKEKGKTTLIYAIIGLALVLLSWTIVNIVLFVVTG